MSKRGRVLVALALVIVMGLASRRDGMPRLIGDHAGDALWATAVVLVIVWIRPAIGPWVATAVGFGIAVAVECSQAWHPGWLDRLRDNDLAALLLGRGFLWGDLVRYAVGCLIGAVVATLLDRGWVSRVGRPTQS